MRYFALTMTALFATALFTGSALAGGMGGESKSMDQKQGSSYGMEQQDQMSGQAGTEQMGQQQQTAGTQLEQQQVRQIQQTLQDRGIDAGPVDGIMGPKTRDGIREFQQEQGLTASGDPTQETLEYMGISPAFGEGTQQQDQMQQDQMQQDQMQQQDSDLMQERGQMQEEESFQEQQQDNIEQ